MRGIPDLEAYLACADGASLIGPEQHYMRGPSPKYRAEGIECNVKTPGTTGTTGVDDKSKSE
jgi:hypothetical protein